MPDVEKNTKGFPGKKYFVDADKVLIGQRGPKKPQLRRRSHVIDASRVVVSKKKVQLRRDALQEADRIKVEAVKEGDIVKSIRISCPCGRHAELDCEYTPGLQVADGPDNGAAATTEN